MARIVHVTGENQYWLVQGGKAEKISGRPAARRLSGRHAIRIDAMTLAEWTDFMTDKGKEDVASGAQPVIVTSAQQAADEARRLFQGGASVVSLRVMERGPTVPPKPHCCHLEPTTNLPCAKEVTTLLEFKDGDHLHSCDEHLKALGIDEAEVVANVRDSKVVEPALPM